MALSKQTVNINFGKGLDLKTDPYQLAPGSFLALQNSIFDKGGLLQKRNGYGALTPLPDASNSLTTTFNGNLTAVGTSLSALSTGSNIWVNKGMLQPISLDTLPLIRSSANQSQADSVVAPNGFVCTAYTENSNVYKYAIADSVTGQMIVNPTLIPISEGAIVGSPRVFILGRYFILLFANNTGIGYHIQYIAIKIATPTQMTVAADISVNSSTTVAFDAVSYNSQLFIAWNADDSPSAVRMTRLTLTLGVSAPIIYASQVGTTFSVSADPVKNNIYVTYYDSASSTGNYFIVDQALNEVLPPTQWIDSVSIANLTTYPNNGVEVIYYEVQNDYSYDSNLYAPYISAITADLSGTIGSSSVIVRSVGLASKTFLIDNNIYFLTIYYSSYQPTYFLINTSGNVVAKLAYSNGSQQLYSSLPNVTVANNIAQVPYLYADLIESVNKAQGAPNNGAGIYTQTGVNLGTFTFNPTATVTSEIGSNLHLTGGFLWMYDGVKPVEHLFHLWPDSIELTPSASGGGLSSQEYFYVATYEWTDAQGNLFRSAPSIPISTTVAAGAVTPTSVFSAGDLSITVSDATGLYVGQELTDTTTPGNLQATTTITSISGTTIGLSLAAVADSASGAGDTLSAPTGSVTLDIPTLRLTYKADVRIVLYRWSVAQQVYYQVTPILSPLLNDPTTDSVSYTDQIPDLSILGNTILYTTGGVIENIAAPATDRLTLWQSRLFLLDSEDRNLIWYSKQVIEGTPVETSDLLTLYVAPTIGAQGSTGVVTALSAMDDKLMIFKENAIYYLNGAGPDNTGANNQFSDPTLIISTVGCANQQSIIFMPQGLMFQSDKGIWLLGRDLSTAYIGAPVESLTQNAQVQSAVNVPGTNQVRFTLDSGITLMYDYYYGQWGTFSNVPAISSTLYQGLHTYINSFGQAFQETPGFYLDGSYPVLMSFTTGWINLAGLQGLERAYYFYMLGTYISPHTLQVQIAYDYNKSAPQLSTITPDNYNPNWGGDPLWGSSSPWGGNATLEQWRVFMQTQKCESFQIQISEVFDPSYGTVAGAGLTVSGLDLVIGLKKGYTTLRPARSVG